MTSEIGQLKEQARLYVEGIAREIARQEIDAALRNYVGGGQVPFCVRVVSPTASATAEVFRHTVPQRARVLSCRVGGDAAAGSVTADVKYVMPGAALATATSLFGANPPSGTGKSQVVQPSSDWTLNILPGTLLQYYITAVGTHTEAEIELIVRAIGNA